MAAIFIRVKSPRVLNVRARVGGGDLRMIYVEAVFQISGVERVRLTAVPGRWS